MDFSKWFHDTYEITEEPTIMRLSQILYSYKSYGVPFRIKNITHTKFIKTIEQYEPNLLVRYNKYKKTFNGIKRRDGWKYD